MDKTTEKLENLKNYIKNLSKVAIAYSSGVDSTFLLKIAHDILKDDAIAITAKSYSFPKRELNESIEFCNKEGIKQIVAETDELKIKGFKDNPPNRCYLCKKELFQKIAAIVGCAAEKAGRIPHAQGVRNDGEAKIVILTGLMQKL